ncbi:MAG: hypothetical protein KDE27_31210 [Planctomycetes bacterium]|nr:hypothetical protein [Planctomycetota bacterium]
MRKLALVLALLPMAACSSWGSGLTPEQEARGIKSVSALSSDYESDAFWTRLRRSADGRSNAFGRDVRNIGDFFDRHFWNYNANDPYVNYPTDTTRLGHIARGGASFASSTPVVGDVWEWFR